MIAVPAECPVEHLAQILSNLRRGLPRERTPEIEDSLSLICHISLVDGQRVSTVTARTAGRRRHGDPAEADDSDRESIASGMMARIADRVLENPAMSGGLIVMVLTAAAVVSNALVLQHSQHPEPWFATRPAPVALAPGSDDVVVPDPRPRAAPRVEPPQPRIQPAAAPTPEPPIPAAAPTLIADLQRALSAHGFYRGKVDGISGSRTRAAITAYEQAQGLPVTGEPSASVLDHITTASIVPPTPVAAAAPPPPPEVTISDLAAASPPPSPVETVAVETAADEPPQPAAEILSYPPRSVEVVPAATNASVSAAPAPESGAQRTLSVQKALNLIGYGPVPEDGVAGEATTDAIRRFELDHGMPITGAAGDALITRLVAIGAMEAA
jgi:peptidoglycan hydrolase-like protein with peptidoglycan-binding domain